MRCEGESVDPMSGERKEGKKDKEVAEAQEERKRERPTEIVWIAVPPRRSRRERKKVA
jgi:hypothetical protein